MNSSESTRRTSRETREPSVGWELLANVPSVPCLLLPKPTLKSTPCSKELTSTRPSLGQDSRNFALTCSRAHLSLLKRLRETLSSTNLLSMTSFWLVDLLEFLRFRSC